MKHLVPRRLGYLCGVALLLSTSAAPSRGQSAVSSGPEPFALRIDMAKADAPRGTLEALAGAVTDGLQTPTAEPQFKVSAKVKGLADTLDYLQVEVFVENLRGDTVDQVVLHLDDTSDNGAPLYNLTQDAYNKQALASPYDVSIGRMVGYGIKRLIFGVKKAVSPVVSGTVSFAPASGGEGQSTTNILVAAGGHELWAVSSDTGEVVGYSLPGKQEIARISVGAEPKTIAWQRQMDWLVVASAKANTVTIIDRQQHVVLNILGKNEEYGRELRQVIVQQSQPVVYVSSYVEGTVSKVTLDAKAHVVSSAQVTVGQRPSGMSMTFDESYLYVAHFLPRGPINTNESWISTVDLATFTKTKEAIIEDDFNPGNPRLKCLADFYNSYAPAQLIYGQLEPKDFSLEGVASQLYGVFLDPAGQRAWIPGTRITGALVVLERGKNADPTLKRFGGLQPAQLSAPILFPMDASQPGNLQPIYTRDVEMAIPTLKPIVTCTRHPLEIEFIDRDLQNDGKEQSNAFLAYGVPEAGLTGLGLVNTVTFGKGGRTAFLLSGLSDEIAVYDGTTINPASQLHFPLSGDNPKGMALTPDFKRAYVLYENSGFISEVDTSAYASDDSTKLPQPYELPYYYAPTAKNPFQLGGVIGFPLNRNIEQVPLKPALTELGQLPLYARDPLPAAMRRGKVLFETANPDKYSVSVNRLGACASCHPDGGNDGSSWVTMEGPRRTLSLRGGVDGRGWLHISATHANSHEFVSIIVPERLGGHLSDADYDALALYIGKGVKKLQNPRVDMVKAAAGKELFSTYCAGCHRGADYTSGVKPNGDAVTFNIGTASSDHGVAAGRFSNTLLGLADPLSEEISVLLRGDRALGPGDRVQEILDFRQRPVRAAGEFKTPSLVGTFDNVIYFHDGSIDNLKDAIARINSLLKLNLTDVQVDELEQYVKTL